VALTQTDIKAAWRSSIPPDSSGIQIKISWICQTCIDYPDFKFHHLVVTTLQLIGKRKLPVDLLRFQVADLLELTQHPEVIRIIAATQTDLKTKGVFKRQDPSD